MQKDIVLALDTARRLRVPLPSAATADEMLTLARAAGYEHRDIAALFEVPAQLTREPLTRRRDPRGLAPAANAEALWPPGAPPARIELANAV